MGMTTIKALAVSFAITAIPVAASADTVSLDSCRSWAVSNNKQMRMAKERIKAAGYQKKEAFSAYLPSIDFAGGYTYNQKNLSIFDSDQHLPVQTFDGKGYQFELVTGPDGMPVKGPDGQYIPKNVAYLPKSAMTYDIHNVFFGAFTLTQPVFMGGKIVAMNKITRYAEELARAMHEDGAEEVIYAVDAAYWQLVSLRAKEKLAQSYLNLLDSLHHDVKAMVDAGVATEADLLNVDVKLNSAKVDMVKVDNGLSLCRMLLAQLCGLPVDTPLDPADSEASASLSPVATEYNMTDVYTARPDIRALELGVKITEEQANVARASMMPSLAVVGAWSFSNPNMYDGYKNRFNGAFSVGAVLRIPIWHWGGNYNKYRAARSEAAVMRLQLDDAKEKIELQVSQAAFKTREALKTYDLTKSNLASADENLRCARLAFTEGMMTSDNVMEAQTAWLKAHSEFIDAQIDVNLCRVYLSKALGTMDYQTYTE